MCEVVFLQGRCQNETNIRSSRNCEKRETLTEADSSSSPSHIVPQIPRVFSPSRRDADISVRDRKTLILFSSRYKTIMCEILGAFIQRILSNFLPKIFRKIFLDMRERNGELVGWFLAQMENCGKFSFARSYRKYERISNAWMNLGYRKWGFDVFITSVKYRSLSSKRFSVKIIFG